MYTTINQQSEIIDVLIAEGLSGCYDTGLIHNEVHTIYGPVPVGEIPETVFWGIVAKYELGRIDPMLRF